MEYPIRFFTATLLKWQHLLKPDKYKQIITDSLKFLVEDNRVWIYGFVVMPNHIHQLWRFKSPHTQEQVQRDFLKFTAQKIKDDLLINHPAVLPHFTGVFQGSFFPSAHIPKFQPMPLAAALK